MRSHSIDTGNANLIRQGEQGGIYETNVCSRSVAHALAIVMCNGWRLQQRGWLVDLAGQSHRLSSRRHRDFVSNKETAVTIRLELTDPR